MYIKDLSPNVPLYGQQQCNWCGAASARMTRNGYPDPIDRILYSQLNLWNTIQLYNSTLPSDANWATDPHGLTGCLQSLSNPANVDWVEFAETTANTLLFEILYWMDQRNYPTPVLINRGGHWVVIVGYVTDIQPISASQPVLQTITISDPEPHNVGTTSTFSAAQWNAGPWNGSIMYSGTWLNKYVAVIEPPAQAGNIEVQVVRRTGERLLPPEEAARFANRWIGEFQLGRQPKYAFLAQPNVTSGKALLVQEGIGRRQLAETPHYYIVPFGFNHDFAEGGSQLTRIVVLVNAFSGAFEEITTFGQPIRYLSKWDALAIVASALHQDLHELKDAEAILRFEPGDITHIRAYPFWEIKVSERTVYVDQLGKLYGKFLPSIPGD
jgi:hypothetical protein